MRVVLAAPHSSTPLGQGPLAWLLTLRWIAVIAQTALVLLAWLWLHLPFPIPILLALLAVLAVSNLALGWARPRLSPKRQGTVAGCALLFDSAMLTAVLSLSGGPVNPFSVFYLVHVALAAALLDGSWALLLSLATSFAFGLLFFVTPEASMHVMHHGIGFSVHLRGMWIAYGLAAAATGTFVAKQARELRARDRELAALKEANARAERLHALHNLAAGAAHELGTPLGTIALVAGELLESVPPGADREDVALLVSQAERCRCILQRMTADAGNPHGEKPEPLPFAWLAERLRDAFPGAPLELDVPDPTGSVIAPREALLQSLSNLVKNALDASTPEAPVQVRIARAASGDFVVTVNDRGTGIAPDALARLGEPFFTTKEPGQGMGLGLFLARALVDTMGGNLEIDSELGAGTRVSLRLRALP